MLHSIRTTRVKLEQNPCLYAALKRSASAGAVGGYLSKLCFDLFELNLQLLPFLDELLPGVSVELPLQSSGLLTTYMMELHRPKMSNLRTRAYLHGLAVFVSASTDAIGFLLQLDEFVV